MSLAALRARIETAARAAGRAPSSVTLIAVSKSQPENRVRAALDAGQRVFGENRMQEALARWTPLRALYPDVELHGIGHLQTNKAKDAVRLFDVIETVDSARLAEGLANEMDKQNRRLPCFLQVNTGEEPQKGGIAPRALEELYRAAASAGLKIEGLMCIPPEGALPDPHFALLHKLAQDLELSKLSMGMSADFETAIRYGATHVRVGSALFGIRENI